MGCGASAVAEQPNFNGNVQSVKGDGNGQARPGQEGQAKQRESPTSVERRKQDESVARKPDKQAPASLETPQSNKPSTLEENGSPTECRSKPDEPSNKSNETISKQGELASADEGKQVPSQQETPQTNKSEASVENQSSIKSSSKPEEPVEKSDHSIPKPDEPVEQSTNQKPEPSYSQESLKEFLELERKLTQMESQGLIGKYQTQHKLLVSRYAGLQDAHKKVEDLKQQTAKEYQDVVYIQHPDVRAMFSNIYHLQSQMVKEQEEYMGALNRQEVAEKQLKSQQEEYNKLYAEVVLLQNKCQEIEKLRNERQKKLDEIFDGKYGSELEEQLEVETDLLTERKDVITKARNNWNSAKVLMEHATNQLAHSTRRWAQINTIDQSFVRARYSMVAETRNYLIAASQNISNTHQHLSNVTIPYFDAEDLKVLNHAISTIFHDILRQDLYMKALQMYSNLNVKASTLLRWINLVLEKTINKDLEQIIPEWQAKCLQLKRERLRLIHVKIQEIQGNDPNEDIPQGPLTTDEQEVLEQLNQAHSNTHVAEPDVVSLHDDDDDNKVDVAPPLVTLESTPGMTSTDTKVAPLSSEGGDPSITSSGEKVAPLPAEGEDVSPTSASNKKAEDNSPHSLPENATETTASTDSKEIENILKRGMAVKPLAELAPVPDMNVLFGNIKELKMKYEQQLAHFSKAREVNKDRVDQSLQDKLQARRNQRKAFELQQLDTSELAKGVTSSIGVNM